jgi:hypothetical protein
MPELPATSVVELRNGARTLNAALGSLDERRTERGSASSTAPDRSCITASSAAADLLVDEGMCIRAFVFFRRLQITGLT